MSNAEKYFGVFGNDSKSKDEAGKNDSSVDELVDKVRRKARTSSNNYNTKQQGAAYKSKNEKGSQNYSPGPEKVGTKKPREKESLDDVVKKASKASTIPSNPSGINPGNTGSGTGRSAGSGGKSGQDHGKDYSKDQAGNNQPNRDRADPIKYFLGEVLKSVKEVYVPDPHDSTYKFSRRLTRALVRNSDEFPDKVLNDGLSIGVYKLLDDLLRGVYK